MKELYYVRGNIENPDGVKQALLDKGGITVYLLDYGDESRIYYIDVGSKINIAMDSSPIGKLILEYGTELQPVEPKETFEPGDKVFVSYNGYWEYSIFSHITPEGQIHCCGVLYDECHHYEPWMKKYLGTTIAWKDFVK